MKLTFREVYNRVVTAYMKNELKPYESCACFIGNMFGGSYSWGSCRMGSAEHRIAPREVNNLHFYEQSDINSAIEFIKTQSGGLYSVNDICRLEANFLNVYDGGSPTSTKFHGGSEETLYKAMESTLLMLREIHEASGEVVEDYVFNKRELCQSEK